MFKILFLSMIVASLALFWGTGHRGTEQALAENKNEASYQVSREQVEAILHRRALCCEIVEEVKSPLSDTLSAKEKFSFELLPPSGKWEILRAGLMEKGCPELGDLLRGLALESVDQIEFGGLSGKLPCHIHESAGVTLPISSAPPKQER
jgi:hypothetical protein